MLKMHRRNASDSHQSGQSNKSTASRLSAKVTSKVKRLVHKFERLGKKHKTANAAKSDQQPVTPASILAKYSTSTPRKPKDIPVNLTIFTHDGSADVKAPFLIMKKDVSIATPEQVGNITVPASSSFKVSEAKKSPAAVSILEAAKPAAVSKPAYALATANTIAPDKTSMVPQKQAEEELASASPNCPKYNPFPSIASVARVPAPMEIVKDTLHFPVSRAKTFSTSTLLAAASKPVQSLAATVTDAVEPDAADIETVGMVKRRKTMFSRLARRSIDAASQFETNLPRRRPSVPKPNIAKLEALIHKFSYTGHRSQSPEADDAQLRKFSYAGRRSFSPDTEEALLRQFLALGPGSHPREAMNAPMSVSTSTANVSYMVPDSSPATPEPPDSFIGNHPSKNQSAHGVAASISVNSIGSFALLHVESDDRTDPISTYTFEPFALPQGESGDFQYPASTESIRSFVLPSIKCDDLPNAIPATSIGSFALPQVESDEHQNPISTDCVEPSALLHVESDDIRHSREDDSGHHDEGAQLCTCPDTPTPSPRQKKPLKRHTKHHGFPRASSVGDDQYDRPPPKFRIEETLQGIGGRTLWKIATADETNDDGHIYQRNPSPRRVDSLKRVARHHSVERECLVGKAALPRLQTFRYRDEEADDRAHAQQTPFGEDEDDDYFYTPLPNPPRGVFQETLFAMRAELWVQPFRYTQLEKAAPVSGVTLKRSTPARTRCANAVEGISRGSSYQTPSRSDDEEDLFFTPMSRLPFQIFEDSPSPSRMEPLKRNARHHILESASSVDRSVCTPTKARFVGVVKDEYGGDRHKGAQNFEGTPQTDDSLNYDILAELDETPCKHGMKTFEKRWTGTSLPRGYFYPLGKGLLLMPKQRSSPNSQGAEYPYRRQSSDKHWRGTPGEGHYLRDLAQPGVRVLTEDDASFYDESSYEAKSESDKENETPTGEEMQQVEDEAEDEELRNIEKRVAGIIAEHERISSVEYGTPNFHEDIGFQQLGEKNRSLDSEGHACGECASPDEPSPIADNISVLSSYNGSPILVHHINYEGDSDSDSVSPSPTTYDTRSSSPLSVRGSSSTSETVDCVSWDLPADPEEITLARLADLLLGEKHPDRYTSELEEEKLQTRIQLPIPGRRARGELVSPKPVSVRMVKDTRALAAWGI
ncbi:hypothetical protein MMC08_001897 [Hypocenomyce scalaris]|nr:hypothetical protein [Hypocenomyce scalaris]